MAADRDEQLLRAKPTIRLLILDASRMGAQLLADALRCDDFGVAYTGSRMDDALAVADQTEVALLIAATDQQCKETCAFARRLRAMSRRMQVILLAEEPDRETVIEAFRAGIRGIFSRTTSLSDLRKCISAVHGGQVWASNGEVAWLLEALTEPSAMRLFDARGDELLSKREQDVVRCVSEGLTNREIANELGLSENTVKNYLFRIFDKLGISSRAELILYAISNLAQHGRGRESGGTRSDEELFRLCELAAEEIIAPTHVLGEMHRDGRGTRPAPASAYMWFLIAQEISAEVNARSRSAAAALHKELTEAERVQARERAAQWVKEHLTRSRSEQSRNPSAQPKEIAA